MFEIKLNENNLRTLEHNLDGLKNKLPQVTARAINRSLEMTRTEITRKVMDKYNVKKRDLVETMKMRKANGGNLEGTLISRGNLLGLDHFKLTPKKRTKNKKKVSVSVKKDGYKLIPNAFIAYHDGRLGAFVRTTDERLPIKRLKGPSAPQMLGEMSVIDHIENYAQEKFNSRFEHEIGRLLK